MCRYYTLGLDYLECEQVHKQHQSPYVLEVHQPILAASLFGTHSHTQDLGLLYPRYTSHPYLQYDIKLVKEGLKMNVLLLLLVGRRAKIEWHFISWVDEVQTVLNWPPTRDSTDKVLTWDNVFWGLKWAWVSMVPNPFQKTFFMSKISLQCMAVNSLPQTAAEWSSWQATFETFLSFSSATLSGVDLSLRCPCPSFPPTPDPQENTSPCSEKQNAQLFSCTVEYVYQNYVVLNAWLMDWLSYMKQAVSVTSEDTLSLINGFSPPEKFYIIALEGLFGWHWLTCQPHDHEAGDGQCLFTQ